MTFGRKLRHYQYEPKGRGRSLYKIRRPILNTDKTKIITIN
jgi:hypothetical protein